VKCIPKLAAASLLLLAFCGCHKSGNGAEQSAVDDATFRCAATLRVIDGAKHAWSERSGAASNATPSWDDLKPFFRPEPPPPCLGKGTYTIGALDELPKCSIAGHNDYFLSELKKQQAPPQ
jgi:hypothetical protein